MNNIKFLLGYDYLVLSESNIWKGIYAPIQSHMIICGGSGSGKSTTLLFWLFQMKKVYPDINLTILDFKKSGDFDGITKDYAVYDQCYPKLQEQYQKFLDTPENNPTQNIIIVDEVAGMLSHFGMMGKEGKKVVDDIQAILANILMLGRSRGYFLVLCMQRFTAQIFPAGSGAVDNFMISTILGRANPTARMSLFAGEHFDGEDLLTYKQGTGLVLIDGQDIQAICIPRVSKSKLLQKLQQ